MDKLFKDILIGNLVELDRVCNQYGLRYFLTGGSMIGAVRHKGIIPWDDDIDVAMPRSDYEKFKIIAPKVLGTDYELIHSENTKTYFWRFAKLCNKNTTLVELEYPFCIEGVFIDIFPLDGMSDSETGRFIQYNKYFKRLSELCILYMPPKKISFSSIRSFMSALKSNFIHYCFSFNDLILRCERIAQKYSYEDSDYIINFAGIYGMKEITKKSYFSNYILADFEGRKFRIPIGYDDYLTGVYGNYMNLPPMEKRKPHHIPFFLNLRKKLSEEEIRKELYSKKHIL